jgi:hypothetical protein
MDKPYPFQAIVNLKLYGSSPEDVHLALREAYEHLSKTIAKTGQAVNEDRAYSFSLHSTNITDDRRAPAIPPQV